MITTRAPDGANNTLRVCGQWCVWQCVTLSQRVQQLSQRVPSQQSDNGATRVTTPILRPHNSQFFAILHNSQFFSFLRNSSILPNTPTSHPNRCHGTSPTCAGLIITHALIKALSTEFHIIFAVFNTNQVYMLWNSFRFWKYQITRPNHIHSHQSCLLRPSVFAHWNPPGLLNATKTIRCAMILPNTCLDLEATKIEIPKLTGIRGSF